MAQARRPPDTSNDPLGETLHLLHLTGTLYCQAHFTAPWGVDIPRLENCLCFQVVTAGRYLLEVEGAEPSWLERGSIALLPHGTPHRVRSAPDTLLVPLDALPVHPVSDRYETVEFGGGGASSRCTYGVLRCDQIAAKRLLDVLPLLIQIDSWDDAEGRWLQEVVRLIAREASTPKLGGETMITRLADILVIQTLRAWLDEAPPSQLGWLAALRDANIGRALAAVHRAPAQPWTVASLSKQAGLSRSAFSARFAQLLGTAPMHYVTEWRMQLARRRLQRSSEPLATIAERVGYGSEAAFCKAFKRTFGVPPSSARAERPR